MKKSFLMRRRKKMKKLSILCVFASILIMAFAITLSAANIPINNYSFEEPELADGGYNTSIMDWTISGGTAGVWNPLVGQTTDGMGGTDPSQAFVNGVIGEQVAYSNGGDISQTLSANIIEGYRYTLKVRVGGRASTYSGQNYAVILAGDSAILAQETGVNIANEWLEEELTYIAEPGDPNIGQPLGIKLINADGTQLDFDKVTLDGTLSVYCTGFLPPFDKPLTLKKNDKRAIPVKMVLRDIYGNIVTDQDIEAPVVVVFLDGNSATDSSGYEADLLPPGLSDDGNTFRYDPDSKMWILNLATKQFTAAGTYTVKVKVGGYYLDCTGTFTRNP
jgi:hypothetical protein